MDKLTAIAQVYRIATLQEPTEDVLSLLAPLEYARALDLLLVLRQSPKPVKSPANFLRRAIAEGWTPETVARRVDRAAENHAIRFYMQKGLSQEEAEERYRQWRRD